jgi:F-type H+-transporting ATPase subunit epsilon
MTTFHLTVVTPDGCAFDGQAERVVCRAIDGDLAILAKHGDSILADEILRREANAGE